MQTIEETLFKQKKKMQLTKYPFKKPWYPCPFEILAEAIDLSWYPAGRPWSSH
jgi:hypothetical protein